jgi:SAM-dependent methyltransferase
MDEFWSRAYPSVDAIWAQLHHLQTEFCFAQELSAYFTSPSWLEARRVIDVGCGCGNYLRRLAAVFPEKQYLGIDNNPYFVTQAGQAVGETMTGNVIFEVRDLFEVSGDYDFLLMRLVMQHQSDPEEALARVAGLLRPGGRAFIIDAQDSVRRFYPEPRDYVAFFHQFAAHQKRQGRDREIAGRLPTMIDRHPQLDLSGTQSFLIPSTLCGNALLFDKVYYLVVQLLEAYGEMDYDYELVKQSWRSWCQSPHYAQVGLRYVTVVRGQ